MRKYWNHIGFLSGITVLIMAMSLFGSLGYGDQQVNAKQEEEPIIEIEETNQEDQDQAVAIVDEPEEAPKPEAINGLLIGFDKSGGLTDVIMVGHIDPETNQVQIISVPRDLEIYFDEPGFDTIKANNPKNHIAHAKLNNLYSLLGWNDQALSDVRSIVEVITDLKIDYMMTVDISGFKDIVDAVGGVTFDVPQRMYYNDPAQDLYIDLQPGVQVLNGEKAMELVRYRKGYARGDLQRIEVQQAFLAALVEQVLSVNDFDTITNLLTTGYSLIESDFGLVVALEYAEFFYDLDVGNLLSEENMMTIPSYGELEDGVWFQYFDLDKAHEEVEALIGSQE